MSHFVMGVVVPEGVTSFRSYVDDAFAPFDENLEVAPYKRKCWCVGNKAQHEVSKDATGIYGSWDEMRTKFHAQGKIKQAKEEQDKLDLTKPGDSKKYSEIEDSIQKQWEAFIKPRLSFEKNALKDHALKNSPRKDCDCKGTGKETVTYNPKSKWDWYQIGGRWDGFFGKENTLTVKEHLNQLKKSFDTHVCFGYLVDGEWVEKGNMGYFGMVSNEKSEKEVRKKVFALLEKLNPNDKIVAVDVHI